LNLRWINVKIKSKAKSMDLSPFSTVLFGNAVQTVFLKKLIFLVCFGSFWRADLKNNFLKIKKYYFDTFRHKKLFKKQQQSHSQTLSYFYCKTIWWDIILLKTYFILQYENTNSKTFCFCILKIFLKKIKKIIFSLL
jgi:hypothetical protein